MLLARQGKGFSFSYSVTWLMYRSSLQIIFLDNDVAVAELSYVLSPVWPVNIVISRDSSGYEKLFYGFLRRRRIGKHCFRETPHVM
jgi:hypothetical protein